MGFVSAWRLALLSVAVIPGIAFAGGLYAYTLTGLTSKTRESYANAGIIAEQVSSKNPCFILRESSLLFLILDFNRWWVEFSFLSMLGILGFEI